MPGEADRLRKQNEALRTEHAGQKRALEVAANGLTFESQRRKKAEARVAELEELNAAFKEELEAWRSANGRTRAALKEGRDRGLLDERFNEIFAPPRPLSIPERQEKLELRVHKLEGEMKRLAAAYDSWDLMRDNHASALYSLQRQVAELHDKRRWWWQR